MKRKLTVPVCAIGSLVAFGNSSLINSDSLILLVGSYAPAQAEGIALYDFNQVTGRAKRLCGLSGVANPSYLTVRNDKGIIYSVGEGDLLSSTVSAIAYTLQPPMLKLLVTLPTGGASPCHVNVSPDGTQLFTANYGGGSTTCYTLDTNGLPQGEPSIIDFNTPEKAARAHFATFTPNGKQMWITDLGRDRIHTLPMQEGHVDWHADRVSDIELPAGAGPRHIDFHPRLQKAYVIDERDGYVNVLDYSTQPAQVVQRILADSVGAHGSGDIHVSPDGRFVYASNRLKADGIAIFAIDQTNGMLTHAGYQLTGPHPRNFIITPNGRYMLVACRDSNSIELYKIDPTTGLLTPDCQTMTFSKPVCLRWVE